MKSRFFARAAFVLFLATFALNAYPLSAEEGDGSEPGRSNPASRNDTQQPKDPADGASAGSTFDPGIEEMVVTGQLLAGSSQDDVVSAVSFSSEMINQEGITNIAELSQFAPNLEINTAFAASNPTLFIRGVGIDDYNANSASAVAVYNNGVYMNSPVGQLAQIFDVSNVEVLLGPQPLLRNANAGAILIEPALPRADLESRISLTYGAYDEVQLESMLNFPVSENIFSRTALQFNYRDGIVENRCAELVKAPFIGDRAPCQDAPVTGLDARQNNVKNWAGRTMLLWEASGDVEWLLSLHAGQNLGQAAQFQTRPVQFRRFGDPVIGGSASDVSGYVNNTDSPFVGEYDFQGKELIDTAGLTIRGDWEFSEGLKLESITGYEWHERNSIENADANPRLWLKFYYGDIAWQVSEELALRGVWGEYGEFDLGGLLFVENLQVNNSFEDYNLQASDNPVILRQDYEQQTRSFAFYGRVKGRFFESGLDYGFLENFGYEGSFRYANDRKHFDINSQVGVRQSINFQDTIDEIRTANFAGWSGEAALTYFLSEDVNVFAAFSHGWKPGGFNGGSVYSVELIEPYSYEQINSYSAGIRSDFFDKMLRFNLTGFHYNFDNLQVFKLEQNASGTPLPRIVNARSATVSGFEFEISGTPLEGLDFRVNFGFLDTEYQDFDIDYQKAVVGVRPPQSERINVDYSGNPLLASPNWSTSGFVQYRFPLGRYGSLMPRFSYSGKDSIFFDTNSGRGTQGKLPEGTIAQSTYWLMNTSLSWFSIDENLELMAWVRNITDQEYKIQSFDLTSKQYRFILDVYGDPRTYGITLTYRY